MNKHVVILGGGLAGLSCAYELQKAGQRVTVIERESHVGGMASSFVEDGDEYWTYDFGPHRFHTKDENLMTHVQEILGDNVVWAKRLSRIFLFGQLIEYPLVAGDVLKKMPKLMMVRAMLDYLWVRVQDRLRLRKFSDLDFESWVVRRYGWTLYRIFFGEYTEKTWGMSPKLISATWASQRITLLNLWDTIKKTLRPPTTKEGPRTLVREFIYPKFGGIGELARGYARKIEAMGGTVLTNAPAIRVFRDGMRVTGVEYGKHQRETIEGDTYVNTIPVTALVKALSPAAPADALAAASALKHLSIVFVYLKLNREQVTADNWVYLPERRITVHRISEFKNFSQQCAPKGKTLVCCEITCKRGDEIWRGSVAELTAIAEHDLITIGLIGKGEVLGSVVKKIPYAYPLYEVGYERQLEPMMTWVRGLQNLHSTGRQGAFRYNNMDQSVEMGRKLAWELATGAASGHGAVATGKEYFG
ncbi:MAG TPA: FAD-dependent oxidoreductase [Planctomycetota bacterium]|nr:FAD-dependent oxidoreductase [Planctomycetota bacterium]